MSKGLREDVKCLDRIATEIVNTVQDDITFYGSYALMLMFPEWAMPGTLTGIEADVSDNRTYKMVTGTISKVCDEFVSEGIIEDYRVKDSVQVLFPGGVDLYLHDQRKISIKIGLSSKYSHTTLVQTRIGNVRVYNNNKLLSDRIVTILSNEFDTYAKDVYETYKLIEVGNVDCTEVATCLLENVDFDEQLASKDALFNDNIGGIDVGRWIMMRTDSIYEETSILSPTFNSVVYTVSQTMGEVLAIYRSKVNEQ